MSTLVRLAHQTRLALPRAARDPSIVEQLSPDGRQRLQSLHTLTDSLATSLMPGKCLLTTYSSTAARAPYHRGGRRILGSALVSGAWAAPSACEEFSFGGPPGKREHARLSAIFVC